MSVINSNISALNAQSSLAKNQVALNQAMQRLSTGVRINSAKDDAAGLAIANRMGTDIRGFAVAMRNANDGISLTQTAEGHLAQITDNLQRIRELAVQASNATNSVGNRSTLNLESTQLVQEIDRIAQNSSFNNIKLLDGSFTSKDFQIGANNAKSDHLAISVANASSSALGVGSGNVATVEMASNVSGGTRTAPLALLAGALSINGIAVGASVSDKVSSANDAASGIAKAAAINAISGATGVTASVGKTTMVGAAVGEGAAGAGEGGFAEEITDGDIKINGVSIGAISAANSAVERGAQVAAAVNMISDQTGVTAKFASNGAVSLEAADGRNIELRAESVDTANFMTKDITGLDITDQVAGTGSALPDATWNLGTSKLTLSSTSPDGITLADISGDAADALGLGTTQLGTTQALVTVDKGVNSIDLTSASGAQHALVTLDAAIETVNNSRASLGAYQNRLQFAVSNLQIGSDNLSAARSRIQDTDYAAETTNLARSQIISQAATAMLAQANQQPQTVLALLK